MREKFFKMLNKNLIFIFLVLILSIFSVKPLNAGFIDDILGYFGVKNEDEITNNNQVETTVSKEVEKSLNENQKEVLTEVEKIYQNIQDVNLRELKNSLNYDLPEQVIINVDEFFKECDNSFENTKSILKTITYNVEDIQDFGDTVVVKIKYSLPSISKIFTKVLPEILVKNAKALLSNQITNENLDSILNSVSNEIRKGNYEIETYTRDFTFKKFGAKWKLCFVDSIIQDANKFIRGALKLF